MVNVAVLVNGFNTPNSTLVEDSFRAAIQAASPESTVTTFDPIVEQVYPDPAKYDLIVLSGGTADPMGQDAWVLTLQGWLRETVQKFPARKIVGVCWGHQTICVTFGGRVASMEEAEMGVIPIQLTDAGKTFFSRPGGQLLMHEFHRRAITTPAPGFTALAEANQAFLSETSTILSFQGHPELEEKLAKTWLSKVPSYMGISDEQKGEISRSMEQEHDGVEIWRRIVEWVKS